MNVSLHGTWRWRHSDKTSQISNEIKAISPPITSRTRGHQISNSDSRDESPSLNCENWTENVNWKFINKAGNSSRRPGRFLQFAEQFHNFSFKYKRLRVSWWVGQFGNKNQTEPSEAICQGNIDREFVGWCFCADWNLTEWWWFNRVMISLNILQMLFFFVCPFSWYM